MGYFEIFSILPTLFWVVDPNTISTFDPNHFSLIPKFFDLLT